MKIRLMDTEKDLDTIKRWWKDFDGTEMHEVILSDIGIMAYDDDNDICAGWLFETNSYVAMVGWFISDSKLNKTIVDKGLKMVVREAERLSSSFGYKILTTYSKNKSMIRRLKGLDYIEGDLDMTQLVKSL